MFCFQRPFTRTPRRSSTGPALEGPNSPGSTKMMKIRGLSTKRRSSEVISDGSRSSSIQFIDQEVSLSTSSSTDTLPGICADYLDGDPLSPGSAPLATPDTLITTNGPSVDDQETQVELAVSPARGPKLRTTRRRRKMLLRITSRLSNSNGNAGESPLSLSPAHFSVRQDSDAKKKAVGGLKARSANDLLSLNASSQEEEDGQSDDETETEEGSSLPSSPAATISVGLAPAQVPYYSFLSANGGAMRQESTSTSSPQLSSGVEPLKRLEITAPSSVADDCPSGMSLLKKPDTLDSGCLPAARSCPNLEQQSTVSSASESSSHSPSPGPCGPRFKPLQEGDIQLCYLNHTRTLVSKILSSKFLRRWETHHLYLNDACLSSKTPTGFLQQPVLYSSMTEVYTVARWDPTYKYCLRIVLPDGSLLLQASNAYTRDQWYHSILWKKNIFKYQHTISLNPADDVVLRELKSMVDFALWTPLQDERINRTPLEAMAKLLEDSSRPSVDEANKKKQIEAEESRTDRRSWVEAVFAVAAPLLEKVAAPPILARLLAKFIQKHPTSSLVPALTTAITRCLKYTVDFGKCPGMRELGQMWIAASYDYEDGEQYIRDYIQMIHGPGSDCPHPRIAPNLAAICIAGIFHRFEVVKLGVKDESGKPYIPPLQCFLLVLDILSEYVDWRPELAGLIHPIPFPPEALSNKDVQDIVLLRVVRRLANDPRCHVHQRLLPMHEIRTGWIYIVAPPNPTCPDDGTLFAEILTSLLKCCCRRKKFVNSLLKRTESACMLLAVRSCQAAQEALGLMLEWRLLTSDEMRVQVTSALQSTPSGRALYSTLCQQQRSLQELQQKGGPKKLTLPTRATDADVALLLGGGALGNLEYLSLAFTSVTSACAEELIKLPGLRHLNLWATQFGDAGLQMISEHLPKLQVLNLCETPVSDRGISTLGSLTNLRKLNLNSTKLSAQAFELLKKRLPALQEFDVRYTEAW